MGNGFTSTGASRELKGNGMRDMRVLWRAKGGEGWLGGKGEMAQMANAGSKGLMVKEGARVLCDVRQWRGRGRGEGEETSFNDWATL